MQSQFESSEIPVRFTSLREQRSFLSDEQELGDEIWLIDSESSESKTRYSRESERGTVSEKNAPILFEIITSSEESEFSGQREEGLAREQSRGLLSEWLTEWRDGSRDLTHPYCQRGSNCQTE